MQKLAVGRDRQAGLSAAMSLVLLSAAVLWVWQSIVTSAWASSATDCIAQSSGVQVHFITDFDHGAPLIAGVELSGFNRAACEGEPVTVTLSGNEAGDPSQPATKLLSVLDSSLEPCSGEPADRPVVIADGRIALRGCSSVAIPYGAAYADMHDATHLRIEVAGQELPTGGEPDGPNPPMLDNPPPDSGSGSDGGESGTSTSGDDEPEILGVQQFGDGQNERTDVPTVVQAAGLLPDAGGPDALMFWVGVGLVVTGTASLMWDLVGRRRPRDRAGDVH